MGVVLFMVAVWLLIISIWDVRKRRVPVWLLIPGGIFALAEAAGQQYGELTVVRIMLPGAVLLLLALTTGNVGYADGIVMLFLGVISGSEKSLLIFGISLFLAAICSLVLLALRKVKKNTGIPFLPFLAAAWLLAALF